jgi:hypothetical protein
MGGNFIGKPAHIVSNTGNFMSNLPGKLGPIGPIGKTINNVIDRIISMTEMVSNEIREKVEQYTCI